MSTMIILSHYCCLNHLQDVSNDVKELGTFNYDKKLLANEATKKNPAHT